MVRKYSYSFIVISKVIYYAKKCFQFISVINLLLIANFVTDNVKLGILSGMKDKVSRNEMREIVSSDDEGWQEKETSRTHSVKFTDELPDSDKEVRIYLYKF